MSLVRSKTATCLFRNTDYYRRDVFMAGLERHGFTTTDKHLRNPQPDDLLLIWNRNRNTEQIAARYEAAGARVLVAENGYIGQPQGGGKFYALALDHHNGAGRWFVGDEPRFQIEEQAWRATGDHILILPQRGIGAHGVRMPTTWLTSVRKRLSKMTDRPLKVRLHPGHKKTDPLEDLRGCHAAVTWGSGAGIKAIAHGYPVFYEFDRWIGQSAARRLERSIDSCHEGDRSELWRRVTWAQFTLEEVASGFAFDGLLNAPQELLVRAGAR